MTGQPERPEDKLERMLSGGWGVPPGPENGGELAAMSEMADALRAAGKQIPAPTRMEAALSRMLAEVGKGTMNKTSTGGFRAMLAAWWSRPVMRTAMATVAAVTVVSGVGLGAAAAMGQADPVRQLLGISSSSTIDVELTGTVVSIDGNTVKVDANGDVRTIVIDENTKITAGGGNDGELTVVDIIVGGTVEVHGKLLADNSIQATRFHLEDDLAGSPTAGVPTEVVSTPGAEPTPGVGTPSAGPTKDHGEDDDDEGDDDNSGPGNGDDDGDNEDNSGPGNGDDDGDKDDNSGPGNGDDDGDNEDNSGPGNGDDDGDNDDNSGPGNGDDDSEDDSGSDDGSDDDDEDNSGPGGGDGEDHE